MRVSKPRERLIRYCEHDHRPYTVLEWKTEFRFRHHVFSIYLPRGRVPDSRKIVVINVYPLNRKPFV